MQMSESIAGYDYDITEPPDGPSAWVEALAGHANALKKQLEEAHDLDQSLRIKVHPSELILAV